MLWEERKDDFIEWLKSEDIDSNKIIDDRWDIDEKDGSLLVTSYRTPFNIKIEKKEGEAEMKEEYANLSIHTDLKTSHLKPHEKVYLYRKMLKVHNESPLLKYCLTHDIKEEPVIRADLDLESISKEEFDHAFENALEGVNDFFSSVITRSRLKNLLDEDVSWFSYHLRYAIKNLIEEIREDKISKKKAIKRLVSKFEFEEEDARNFINSFIYENALEKIWMEEITFENAVKDTASDLDIDEHKTENLMRKYIRYLLIQMIDKGTMDFEEAMLWLIEKMDFDQGEAYRFLNEEENINSFDELLKELEETEKE